MQHEMNDRHSDHLGLGVDCGGTYTDAVVYDLDTGVVLAAAKYPTSHHDLTRCIDGVLDGIPSHLLRQARLACLSTTLATNAIVEGRGGKACLILVGYEVAASVPPFGARVVRLAGGHDVRGEEIEPLDEARLQAAIRENDQLLAAALISRYGQLGYSARPVFDLMLKFATSEDGALHAEKYYNTVSAEFASTRPAFRWGHLVALARVTASEFGYKSAGYEEAKKLLQI